VNVIAGAALAGLIGISSARAQEPTPTWVVPDLAAPARAEGSLTIYSSMNEQEGLPLWKMFEDAAGVCRASRSKAEAGSAAGTSRSPLR